MTKFIGLISAKGGVGKTTTTINLTSAFHHFKRNVIALDANFANPDMGIHLGMTNLEKDLHSSLKGKNDLRESVYKHPSGLMVVPGSISYKEARTSKRENLLNAMYSLIGTTEAVMIDSTPGLGVDARTVIRASDMVLIVTTPDLVSVTGSLKMVRLSQELNKQILGIIVNKKREHDYELSVQNIQEFLGQKVLGVIPDDNAVRLSLRTQNPVVFQHPENPASISFKQVAAEILGDRYKARLEEQEKTSPLRRALESLGFKRFK